MLRTRFVELLLAPPVKGRAQTRAMIRNRYFRGREWINARPTAEQKREIPRITAGIDLNLSGVRLIKSVLDSEYMVPGIYRTYGG